MIPRYVAIGDSSTEGLDDPDGRGHFRGWADRLAEHVARANGGTVEYANLAIRGRRTRQILEQQLAPALAMRPTLATCFTGTNDVIRTDFDPESVRRDVETMWSALRDAGATVLSFTLPDLSAVIPFARRITPRVEAMNAALRETARATGTILVDFSAVPLTGDPRLWSEDRLHANALGHERIAAALAQALGLPGADDRWAEPLPPSAPPSLAARAAAEVRWTGRYLAPWVWRRLTGRSSGDGVGPKRPTLAPLHAPVPR
jgi:lysophospholipase L1-like esterase